MEDYPKIKNSKYSIKALYPVFPTSHPLSKPVNDLIDKSIQKGISNYKKSFAEFYDSDQHEWDLTIEPVISRNDSKVVSILFYRSEYTGGNHPNTHTDVVNVAVINNKPQSVTLADIASPTTTSYRILNDLVLPKINDARLKRTNDSENTITELADLYGNTFVISKNGLTFIYDKYTFGSYVEGSYNIKLSWAELNGQISEQLIRESAQ
ncbi:MAG: DUF4163 domain-containing protein [Fimbriimonadaceae bacterium]|nr:MAG: DUF4163 domain-containing protein [Fimbriimonadaceae bacterium]